MKDYDKDFEFLHQTHSPAFVGLSNWNLDSSKQNRHIFVARTDLNDKELEETAFSIINHQVQKKEEKIPAHDKDIRFWATKLTATYLQFSKKEKV